MLKDIIIDSINAITFEVLTDKSSTTFKVRTDDGKSAVTTLIELAKLMLDEKPPCEKTRTTRLYLARALRTLKSEDTKC